MEPESKHGLDVRGLRSLCGNWPGVSEEIKWGADLVFSVAGKMFVITPSDGSEGGRLSFKAAEDRFLELTDRPGIVPAAYLARARWVSVIEPGRFSTETLQGLVRESYLAVHGKLSKKLQAELGPLPITSRDVA
ncbi:MmcQ/YjbR family DNA-binding protein [Rhodanobacter sp. L36]|uniref:MmcQ/YjbR family DNA-binding protein n=1 Tax=Rhodanobacter sp. L36 TaxID=1747221 RepID=UPI00131D6897|nr:MmcQ/YjbR family DNA-binding protein [Rhodanobacter sp. L36]